MAIDSKGSLFFGGRVNITAGKDRGLAVLAGMLLLYVVIFSGIGIWRFENFLFDNSGDQILFEQVIYNTAHGNFFYNNFSRQNHFGDHNSPMLALLAPFTWLMPAPYVLTIFTVLSVAVAAIPVYLLASNRFGGKRVSLLLTAGFLMLPAFVSLSYVSFHEINLVLPFLTFAFYFFVRERFAPFMAMFVMGLLVKEDVALTLFMFAPYAALRKRARHWVVVPAVASVAWFFFSIKVVIPWFNKQDQYGMALSYFSNLGNSLSELVINTVTRPMQTIEIMVRPEKIKYLLVMLLPVGLFLPLLSAEALFALPSVLFNLLGESTRFRLFYIATDSGAVLVPRHMSLMAVTFLYISACFALAKICALFPEREKKLAAAGVLVLLVLIGYSDRFLLSHTLYVNRQAGSDAPSAESIKRILTMIPKGATVKSSLHIANHLYDRKEAFYPANNPTEADFMVVTNQDRALFDFAHIASIAYNYTMIAEDKNISLYRKK